jgi:hypothetical protein
LLINKEKSIFKSQFTAGEGFMPWALMASSVRYQLDGGGEAMGGKA